MSSTLHRGVPPQDAVGVVSDQSRDGDRQGRLGRRERAHARSAPVRTSSCRSSRTIESCSPRFDGYFEGPPRRTPGFVLKVVPGRHDARARAAQRGRRSRRQRPVARHRVADCSTKGAAGRDRPGDRLRVRRPEPPGSHPAADWRFAKRSATRSIVTRSSSICARVCHHGRRHRAADVMGVRADGVRLQARSSGGGAAARRRRVSRSRRSRAAAPLALSLKTSTSEVYRLQAAAIQHDLARVGIALEIRSSGAADACPRTSCRGNFQIYTLQLVGVTDPDMLRLVYHSAAAADGLNRVHYRHRRSIGCIETGRRRQRTTSSGARYTQGAAAASRRTCRTSASGTETNVAIFQPDIHGVSLSPIADFTFLRNVYRDAAPGGTDAGRHLGLMAAARTGRPTGCASRWCWAAIVRQSAHAAASESLRSTAALPHDFHRTLRHSLPSAGRGAGTPGCELRGGGGFRDRRAPGRASRAYSRHPRRSARSIERVGHRLSVQLDRACSRPAPVGEHHRQHQRSGFDSCSRTSTHTSCTSRNHAAGSAACGACSDGSRCFSRTHSFRSGRSRASRRMRRA